MRDRACAIGRANLLVDFATALRDGADTSLAGTAADEIGLLICRQIVDDVEDLGFSVHPDILPPMTYRDNGSGDTRLMSTMLRLEDPAHQRILNLQIQFNLDRTTGFCSLQAWAGTATHDNFRDASVIAASMAWLQRWDGSLPGSDECHWRWVGKTDHLQETPFPGFRAFSQDFAAHLSQELSA